MLIHAAQSAAWAALWAITLWSTINSIQGCFFILSDTSNKLKLNSVMTYHRNLTSICWAILIVFWWN